MSKLKLLSLFIFFVGAVYLAFSSPKYPAAPSDSVQSLEKADVENASERRAYFTNFSREEILDHYEKELEKGFPIYIPSYRVIYPPEDAQTLIRDQTRSVHLPEIIHPARESVFVNIFEPRTAKDEIWYKGVHYQRKITVRYLPTSVVARLLIILPGFGLFLYLLRRTINKVFCLIRITLNK